ncbi:hypothetical protein [uncultured Gammaproteobacteria bacterium]|nr:hypothetical protein [uncultured Gammaproteobacteria bacterium]SSC09985.1 hypothetical protein BPUTEOSOX_840 [thiotrophic endosymbiont of Bathymodiolus puteoserpentis (Logatchev)]CAC9628506.1 hypothetical protein [uncultured Gammaproteobacteria bacterium]CAC9645542.1 hypothetical protein [uncultured Gammaproteobacteria bacterium]CAC9645762.1 hypothetical protein [uncultured Gammaproteobacteria bacterium]
MVFFGFLFSTAPLSKDDARLKIRKTNEKLFEQAYNTSN